MVVLVCFVGWMTCLETGLEVLAVVVLEVVGFDGFSLDIVGLEGATLTELVLGLDRVALEGVALGLGDVFLVGVGWGFFGATPRSEMGFVLVGLVLVVAAAVGFFLMSVPAIVFLELLFREGFVGGALEGF